ncbi:AgmX/PglI C-terminal domain-containing protein [Pyxidicoccus xibeiensis]|uniref:AgmX/PglI C-terminal domain-containing protein n=1 Tax=Pyxidicoccus xibeiensis TaxID=2906759 RepID=UPI0020A6ECA9|nr:AgmX/PglI C-terminal domain-containing protein [Pyxidicoccus xibeiensis]MCP3136397.1 AgmX/PglI C-terminal domain-containing protein [Pyxidicoccus xibeiensis]
MSDVLDVDLDAYLDRELFVRPRLDSESEARDTDAVTTASGSMRTLLDLAERESEWLKTLPPPALSEAEALPEPVVEIPEWMRMSPGAKETTRFAAMLSPVDPDAVHAAASEGAMGAGTDAAGLPATPWSTPVQPVPPTGFASAPLYPPGNLLPGIAPAPGLPMQGAPLHPWGPAQAYPQQPWGMPLAAHPEPKRLLGLRPGAFLGAAAAGVLAAGLLVVAGLHFRDSGTGAGTQGVHPAGGTWTSSSTAQLGGQVSPGTGSGGQSGGTSLLPGTGGVAQQGGTPGLTGAAQVASGSTAQVGSVAGAAQPGTEATLQGGAPGAQLPGVNGAGATGVSEPSGAQQAAASVAGTVLSTAQGDVLGAANGLRAPQPTSGATNTAVGGTTLTSGTVAAVAPSTRKAPAKTVGVTLPRAAANEDEETAPAASELSFDEGESEAGGMNVPSESGDAETSPGEDVAEAAADARPRSQYSELDEDFARELGFTEDAENKEAADPRASRTVYIPPVPDAKQHLTPDDVNAVVVANQPAITACIRQHAQGTPVEGGGRFLVQWSVLPSGETTSVSMSTDTLRATPLARCIEDVVRRWKFPVHQVRMEEPIRFPFVF